MIKTALASNNYQILVDKIDDYFTSSNIVLQDDRNLIKEINFKGEKLIVKMFKQPTFIKSVIYGLFKKSKAKRCYEFAIKIVGLTPNPIAYIEYYQYGLLAKSYFISAKFDYDFDIRKPLLDNKFGDRGAIFTQFANFVYRLHKRQVLHQDLSPGNILIKRDNSHYQFNVIDINRMVFKPLTTKARANNFARLWADDADLTSILKEYAQIAGINNNVFIKLGLKYNQKHKANKIYKRKIKQLFRL